jgi:2-polyprenyl-3-methyl-5-hydroxy-6-metoxy-1,4-benzoquinol methylase
MTNQPFVDFYESKKIIPVHQDTTDMRKHLHRRNALYHQLGLIPAWMAGRSVIEFGPGTGDNAIHTSSLDIARYVLVDGNSESIREVKERVTDGRVRAGSVDVIHSLATAFESDERFDLVLCEGLVPGQLDPSAFVRRLSSFCKPGGVIVTTTIGATSCLGDTCRRVIKPFASRQVPEFWAQVELLVQFFKRDVEMLQGMSRYPKDWVLDTVMYDWGELPWFPLEEAVGALRDEFMFHGSSPKFFQDLRWYKSIREEDFGFSELAIQQYNRLAPLLLDYRASPETCPSYDQIDGPKLESMSAQAYAISRQMHSGDTVDGAEEFVTVIEKIVEEIRIGMPETAKSLEDFCTGVLALRGNQDLTTADFGTFRGLFGRGQQYLSMAKIG